MPQINFSLRINTLEIRPQVFNLVELNLQRIRGKRVRAPIADIRNQRSSRFPTMHHTERLEFLTYAFVGLLIACSPLLMRRGAPAATSASPRASAATGAAVARGVRWSNVLAMILAALVGWGLTGLSVAGVNADLGLKLVLAAGALAGSARAAFFQPHSPARDRPRMTGVRWVFALVFAAVLVALNFSSGYFTQLGAGMASPQGFWHHWGAYISAAKSLDAGLAIYRDFPSQYGFGPSLLIAIASRTAGWFSGMFFAVAAVQCVYAVLLAFIGLRVTQRAPGPAVLRWAFVLLVTLIACLFWPPGGTLSTNGPPSLGGARYLPATVMAAALLMQDFSHGIARRQALMMHVLWTVCAAWSLEAAFHASLIWWPCYVFLRYASLGGSISRRIGQPVLELLAMVVLSITAVCLIYRLVYGELPDPAVYVAILGNIPGALLVDFGGPFLFLASTFAVGLMALVAVHRRHGVTAEFRNLFVTTLLAYAASSYYVGRSADYNILPLIPFFVLVFLAMMSPLFPGPFRSYAVTAVTVVAAWLLVASVLPFARRANAFEYAGHALDAHFIACCEREQRPDLGRALREIGETYGESAIAIDPVYSVTLSGNQQQWNAYNNMASYSYLPLEMQKTFVERSMRKLRKAGWVLVDREVAAVAGSMVFEALGPSYDCQQKTSFGVYAAYRCVPRAASAPAQ